MSDPTRRQVLAGGALAGLPSLGLAQPSRGELDSVAADLARYVEFGVKASGGPGDDAAGGWLSSRLAEAGFAVSRQDFDVPYFDAGLCELTCADARAAVIPQAPVVPSAAGGVTGRLVHWHAREPAPEDMRGAIALVTLPHARWSTILSPAVRETMAAAEAKGAAALVLITTGPTGKAIALNAPAEERLFRIPVAILAPEDAAPIVLKATSGASARLRIEGRDGQRRAYNVIGKLDRGKGRWVIVSTPRSGWFVCAGERGPGIAVWLDLARWAPAALPDHDLLFVSASGHEYEYLGAEHFLAQGAPCPDQAAFWFHLGANVATRDWQEAGSRLLPLPSPDPQRFLLTSEEQVSAARTAFTGEPGLEMAYPVAEGTGGELAGIAKAGYPRLAGIFGAHRFHHIVDDDERCLLPSATARASTAIRQFLMTVLRREI